MDAPNPHPQPACSTASHSSGAPQLRGCSEMAARLSARGRHGGVACRAPKITGSQGQSGAARASRAGAPRGRLKRVPAGPAPRVQGTYKQNALVHPRIWRGAAGGGRARCGAGAGLGAGGGAEGGGEAIRAGQSAVLLTQLYPRSAGRRALRPRPKEQAAPPPALARAGRVWGPPLRRSKTVGRARPPPRLRAWGAAWRGRALGCPAPPGPPVRPPAPRGPRAAAAARRARQARARSPDCARVDGARSDHALSCLSTSMAASMRSTGNTSRASGYSS